VSRAFPGARAEPASCGELFGVMTRVALQGFGGVLAVAQHELVEHHGWMTKAQFVEMLSLGQVLPGPNVVNLSLMIGDRFFGTRGALAAIAGMLLAPLALVLVLAALYTRFAAVPLVAGALRGMGAVAAGLVIGTAIRLLPTLKGNALGLGPAALVLLLTFVSVGVLHWPLVWVVLGLGGLAYAGAWWGLRGR
jgi:chromate transporter